jgi:hypothetical protein
MNIPRHLVLFLLVALANRSIAQTSWPIEPVNQDHPIANNMGDFWRFADNTRYQHPGVDILADPASEPNAPHAYVTVPGTIINVNSEDPSGRLNEVQIDGTDGLRYVYLHLDNVTLAAFEDAHVMGTTVTAGTPIALIYDWGCGFSHLHYEISEPRIRYINPLTKIAPNPDDVAPRIDKIFFADRLKPRWSQLPPVDAEGPACTVVKGKVEIIAKQEDRDDAGEPATVTNAGNVGVYDLRWRACPKNLPNCTTWNDTHRFDQMPVAWHDTENPNTLAQFSTSGDWITTANECSGKVDDTFRVATGLAPSAWDTNASPDGSYTVSLEARDVAGNVSISTALACVQNAANCATDLAIRDAESDTGATPYLDLPFWMSPDIRVNPATAFENSIRETKNNVIEVDVRNVGSCTLPVGSTYAVCLGWSLPSPYIPFPMAANQTVKCVDEMITATGWSPGTKRTTTFNWTPSSGSVPQGHNCLVAWSSVAPDPVQPTTSVILDNNRAQRNITFVGPPPLGGFLAQTFYVHHLDTTADRSMEIRFNSNGDRPFMAAARLHVPPSVKVAGVEGAELIAAYRQVRPRELCAPDDTSCRVECPDLANATRLGCTTVWGRINADSRVKLGGMVVGEKSEMLLEVSADESIPPGKHFEAEIVEFANSDGRSTVAMGGLTMRFGKPARR